MKTIVQYIKWLFKDLDAPTILLIAFFAWTGFSGLLGIFFGFLIFAKVWLTGLVSGLIVMLSLALYSGITDSWKKFHKERDEEMQRTVDRLNGISESDAITARIRKLSGLTK